MLVWAMGSDIQYSILFIGHTKYAVRAQVSYAPLWIFSARNPGQLIRTEERRGATRREEERAVAFTRDCVVQTRVRTLQVIAELSGMW